MAHQALLKTFPLVLVAGLIVSIVTTPLICKSFDLRNDHENQCYIYNTLLNLKVNLTGGCPYDKVMDLSQKLMLNGIIFLSLVIFLVGVMWFLIICSSKHHRVEIGILSTLLAGATVVLVVFMYDNYKDLLDFQEKDEGMNLTTLQAEMKSSLKINFLSDNITSPNKTSDQWNILFIEYKCCGVSSIHGTTNDFDTSPWCTTSGSCQQTNSQIPKTCCLGVTMEDYQSADKKCHADVSPQTYNVKGCYLALKEILTVEGTKHNMKIDQVLCEGMKVLIAMGVCIILPVFGFVGVVCRGSMDCCKGKSKKKFECHNGHISKEEK